MSPPRSLVRAEDTSQGETVSALPHSEEGTSEIRIAIGTRVRCIEKLQLKIGARSVTIKAGDQGTVVQLLPNLGVDWDCLPSVDKIFVKEDMIEALPPQGYRAPQPAVYMEGASPQTATSPLPPQEPVVATMLPQLPAGSGARPPNVAPSLPQGAPTLPQVSPSLPQLPLVPVVGHGSISKSSSLPSLSMEHSLPLIDSPDKSGNRRPVFTGIGHAAQGVVFLAGAGPRPLSMTSNSFYMKNHEDSSASKPAGQLRQSSLTRTGGGQCVRRTLSPPPKFIVRGEECTSPAQTFHE